MVLSVILPIHNTARYLPVCVESIIKQGLDSDDFELILIENASTDDSLTVCHKLKELYADYLITVVHTDEPGVGNARNIGLKYAHGEYIHFIDTDDWIEKGMYLHLLSENSKKYDYLMFLCSIEKLLVLKDILNNSKNIIAISKNSDNNDIFKSRIPDIAIFDNYTKKEGISNLIYKDVSKSIKQSFPVEDDFFNQLTFTIFYLRLADNKNVLKVELPYKASFKEVVKLVGKIKKFSTGGYPFLLKKTHKDVVISNKNMDELLKIMHIREKSGREMLR